ncbi:hypothetical protein BD309DRAFT_965644 [Dichomitus squalens]|nr:hypothetical protein BD309DRAFT_965644 [Dichomitus squalens]
MSIAVACVAWLATKVVPVGLLAFVFGAGSLWLVGFRFGGIARGTLAAAMQSAIYQGRTTGVFSKFQSLGAGLLRMFFKFW